MYLYSYVCMIVLSLSLFFLFKLSLFLAYILLKLFTFFLLFLFSFILLLFFLLFLLFLFMLLLFLFLLLLGFYLLLSFLLCLWIWWCVLNFVGFCICLIFRFRWLDLLLLEYSFCFRWFYNLYPICNLIQHMDIPIIKPQCIVRYIDHISWICNYNL